LSRRTLEESNGGQRGNLRMKGARGPRSQYTERVKSKKVHRAVLFQKKQAKRGRGVSERGSFLCGKARMKISQRSLLWGKRSQGVGFRQRTPSIQVPRVRFFSGEKTAGKGGVNRIGEL